MLTLQNFLVVDTEGKDQLKEIAVLDSQGRLVYEAFSAEHNRDISNQQNVKPLREILTDFANLSQSQLLIFHYASHDLEVLKNSYQAVDLKTPLFTSLCTLQLAQRYVNNFESYSLEYLSKKLNLQINNKYFSPQQAHAARYDAEFTYQLYLYLQERYLRTILKNKPNPFSSSRVDNPFQNHADLFVIYQDQFKILKSVITEVKQDKNHQSRGVVVIGEPGSGKTHLMMRLAKELLRVNRLLFVRCPNHADYILYHTYSRILESLMTKVSETGYSQLEYLLAHSFVKLISQSQFIKINQKDQDIAEFVKSNPLNLYESLGAEGTVKKRDYWQHIEKRTRDWWIGEYGVVGYADRIIRGIIKFCSYTEPSKKQLVARWLAAEELSQEDTEEVGLDNWTESMSKEAFSLEAISVFSRLSLLDEPMIIIFDQLEALGYKYNEKLLFNFGESVKEIFTHVPNSIIILNLFPERWQQFQTVFDSSVIDRISQNRVNLTRPNNQQLQEIISLKLREINLDIKHIFSSTEVDKILTGTSIRRVLNLAADYYNYKASNIPIVEDVPDKPVVTSENSSLEKRLEKVENTLENLQTIFSKLAEVITLNRNQEILVNKEVENPVTTEVDIKEKVSLKQDSEIALEYLAKNRLILAENYSHLQIVTDSDDLGKLIEITNALATVLPIETDYLRLGKSKIPEHLVIKTKHHSMAIAFLEVDGVSFTTRLKNFNQLVIHHSDIFFQVWRDERNPQIKGKVGVEEIGKLNYAPNGEFMILTKTERINLELMYKLITDIQNQDLEVDLKETIPIMLNQMKDSQIIQAFI